MFIELKWKLFKVSPGGGWRYSAAVNLQCAIRHASNSVRWVPNSQRAEYTTPTTFNAQLKYCFPNPTCLTTLFSTPLICFAATDADREPELRQRRWRWSDST
jgi:hypothetical protein